MKVARNEFSMIEVQLESFVEAKRNKDDMLRKQLDFAYSWDGKTALLLQKRPQWNDPSKVLELPFAKLRLVKSTKIWKLYWMRGSDKWEAYAPKPESTNLRELLDEISQDGYGCFLG